MCWTRSVRSIGFDSHVVMWLYQGIFCFLFSALRSEPSPAPNGMSYSGYIITPSFHTGMWDPITRSLYLVPSTPITDQLEDWLEAGILHTRAWIPLKESSAGTTWSGHGGKAVNFWSVSEWRGLEQKHVTLPSNVASRLWNLTNVKNVNEEGCFVLGIFRHGRCDAGK